MKLNDTYNIHKKINSIFPFFKSKYLCKKGIHNYILTPHIEIIPNCYQEIDNENNRIITKVINYEHIFYPELKCLCCGKRIECDDFSGEWREE